MTSQDKIYIRIKRRNQTFNQLCNSTGTVHSIKEQIVLALHQHKNEDNDNDGNAVQDPDMLLLLGTDKRTPLADDETIESLQLKNNDILYVVFEVADNEYESVDIDEMMQQGA